MTHRQSEGRKSRVVVPTARRSPTAGTASGVEGHRDLTERAPLSRCSHHLLDN
jgi:hypothetical protein